MDLNDTSFTDAEAAFEQALSFEADPESFKAHQAKEEDHQEEATEEVVDELEAEDATEEVDEAEEELEAESEEEEEAEETDEYGQWMQEMQESVKDDPKLLDSLQLKIKVNGELQDVTLGDLKQAQMREADYTRKTQEVAKQRKEFEAKQATAFTEVEGKFKEFASMTQVLEQQLTKEFQDTNWDELRQYDPAEFAAKRQEYQDKATQINQMKQHGLAQAQEVHQRQIAQQREMGMNILMDKMPELKDESVRTGKFSEIKNVLSEYDWVDPQFIDKTVEPAILMLANEVIELRKGKKTIAGKSEKIKKLPKFTRPGAKRRKDSVQTKQQKSIAKAKRSGSLEDAANAFAQFL